MKSLAELQALRDKMKNNMGVRGDDTGNIRVVVGMATCGIAAGARPVLQAFTEEAAARGLTNVTISQTGTNLPAFIASTAISICPSQAQVIIIISTFSSFKKSL